MADGEEAERGAEHPAVRRVIDTVGAPDLAERLSGVSGADLTSFLLELMRRRAAKVQPARVLERYRSDRFVAPAALDLRALRRVEDAFMRALPDEWEALVLSPLTPFATHAAMGGLSQDWVVSTVRATEVAADPTNSLALEAAVRRRAAKAGVVRLATVQRVTRAQRFAGGGLAHFSLFALVTAGRDPGGYAFEAAALSDQVAIHVQSVLSVGATEVRVLLTDLTNGERDAVLAAVEHRFAATPLVSVVRDPERLEEAGGYYQTARFKVRATFDGPEFEVSDGGFTAWTQRLLHDDRGERLCISGSGLDRLAEL